MMSFVNFESEIEASSWLHSSAPCCVTILATENTNILSERSKDKKNFL